MHKKANIDRDRYIYIYTYRHGNRSGHRFLFAYIQITTCTYENEMDIHAWIHICVKQEYIVSCKGHA